MRRLFCGFAIALAISLLAPAASQAALGGAHRTFGEIWQARLLNYYFASSANPLLGHTCGRVSHGVFLLSGAVETDEVRHCAIPAGMPLLASPGGFGSWRTSARESRAELQAGVTDGLHSITDIHATLDGKSLRTFLARGYVRRIALHPGNFIQTVDPTVTGSHTLIATAAYLHWIRPLTCGRHVIKLSDSFGGTPSDITFHLTVC